MRWKRKIHHGGPSKQQQVSPLADEVCAIDKEVSHLCRIKSEPSQRTRASIYAGQKRPVSTFKLLSGRESNCSGMGRFSSADCSYALRKHLPVKGPWCVDDMDSEAYISQFSADGSLLIGGFRGSHIRVYNSEKNWKVHKDITCKRLRWTISDIALSPDQQFLAYSSLSPTVHIVNVQNAVRESHANITADVNVVTFADETNDILYSGSDDSLCKVWDRRCHKKQKPVGVLTGHLDGITFIDSRGDGHYFISNCKDQTIKLWDLRKMSSTTKERTMLHCIVRRIKTVLQHACPMGKGNIFRLTSNAYKSCTPKAYEWDYRWMTYPSEARYLKHPYDQSLATFRGHSVLRTLIRCYFSPMHSTGQRYIYTGSSDQCVYIYDVATGKVVEKLRWHGSIIRDCSWHPYLPTLVSSSWDGYLVRWEATEDDRDPSMLRTGKQRMHPEGYTMSFVL
ncbi:LEC14B homolog isoform X3 [Panicum virgatum]|uniref:LEC14B homolog isoform X3 n=1 Tax=Panicum virgatum TaxID=38727 RepID=UPI0019D5441B|nr:LEC14B homolog isoform X3 [Panicum virgatum]